ncbi:uncharacterized protein BXZ73DRAFT_87180 [Epithele typhae]|uniref:uncharacterized protein n=1 Tax=Epithele typhae TaxID=378194 RepID=UPI0020086303|nr:uncharacterized protein BXZ73DRAFT_87180 [Epithele typhae]KAH9944242.1 hypothetical protein BXZ73DRAFT_87180 [Epithele typhae]
MLIVGIAIGHAVMLLSHHPQGKALRPVLPLICPTPSSSLETLTAFTPRFIVGVAFALAGGLFRWVAMRKLGGLFTYEVVIKDDHQLVASGPYSIVRHPGYTGVLLLLIGVHLSLWDDAGYISQCNLSYTPQFMFMPMLSTFAVVNLARRCSGEDAQLRSHFGETWEKYRAQVPYCMIPYMY